MGTSKSTKAIKGSVGRLRSISEFTPNSFNVKASGVKKIIEKTKVSKEKKARRTSPSATGVKQYGIKKSRCLIRT